MSSCVEPKTAVDLSYLPNKVGGTVNRSHVSITVPWVNNRLWLKTYAIYILDLSRVADKNGYVISSYELALLIVIINKLVRHYEINQIGDA